MATVIPATMARSQTTESAQDSPTVANLKRKLADSQKEKQEYDNQAVVEENLETRELTAPSTNKTEANWHKSQADFYHRQVQQYRDWSAKKQNEIFDVQHQIFVEEQKELKQRADKAKDQEEYKRDSGSGTGAKKASKTLPPMKPIPDYELPKLSPRYLPENGEQNEAKDKGDSIGDEMKRKYQRKDKYKANPQTGKLEKTDD